MKPECVVMRNTAIFRGRRDRRNRFFFSFAVMIIAALSAGPAFAADKYLHHSLTVVLAPADHRLTVSDTITLPKDSAEEITFLLHGGLKPTSPASRVRIQQREEQSGPVPLETWSVILPPGLRTFTIAYEGTIYHLLEQPAQEQARGFGDTPGIISPMGVFLSEASSWYPDFGQHLVTFDMNVTMPRGWDAVSQGERTRREYGTSGTTVSWNAPEPQEQIYLVANKFTGYDRPSAQATAMVFLRAPDEVLANKYLDATIAYLQLYGGLIGAYPYKKFALVENFWETGFGMPSFTLLGPKVVRLPFIINTSYPHEILHNWWGNSVYPDLEQGNWSEGLTACLSDLLMKEQQGNGQEYRMTTLQKYADYVRANRDFPLTQFRSRHSSSSEAVGYGKGLMFFHMLRQELGDDVFRQGLKQFYRDNRFRSAAFSDIRRAFEAASGKDLKQEFEQWTSRTGAPRLTVRGPRIVFNKNAYVLSAKLEQTQPGSAYRLRVPVAVTLEGQERAFQTTVTMDAMETALTITLPARPQRLDIDPEFDVFRRLAAEETPPAISQALGAGKMLIILPASAENTRLAAYRAFADVLGASGPDEVDVKTDAEVAQLPADKTVVVLGWENRFYRNVTASLSGYDIEFRADAVRIGRSEISRKDHALVLAARLAPNSGNALLFIASDLPAALPGLGRKLPHYHKYSYLAFEGQEPANSAKGRWPVLDSPMTVFIPDEQGAVKRIEMAKLAPRAPLASLAPVFSRDRMMETVRFLASDRLEGRGFGTPGLDKAADHIAQQFKEAGLAPGGDSQKSWFQSWEESGGDPVRKTVLKNVIGILPGTKPDLKAQSVVAGAHYDHLGTGWPESRDKAWGKVHPGADDNASGIAVLLELARVLAQGPRPDRTIVFVAFSGEEAGRRGSKQYVANEKRFPANECIGMVNLDTVGRLGKQKLLALGSASAAEWPHIIRGAGFVTGVDLETVTEELDSSDQTSFQDAGVPAIQLFSGPHLDYHRSTDTPDKIDADGLVRVASVAKEVVEYLAGREPFLTRGTMATVSSRPASTTARRAVLGTIPDFAYAGSGFRLAGTVPGSPAEQAGLREGDIILRINDAAITGLKSYSDFLKTLSPGDRVSIRFLREGKEMSREAMVKEK